MDEPEPSLKECKEKAEAVLPDTCIQCLESHNWDEQVCSMDVIQKASSGGCPRLQAEGGQEWKQEGKRKGSIGEALCQGVL